MSALLRTWSIALLVVVAAACQDTTRSDMDAVTGGGSARNPDKAFALIPLNGLSPQRQGQGGDPVDRSIRSDWTYLGLIQCYNTSAFTPQEVIRELEHLSLAANLKLTEEDELGYAAESGVRSMDSSICEVLFPLVSWPVFVTALETVRSWEDDPSQMDEDEYRLAQALYLSIAGPFLHNEGADEYDFGTSKTTGSLAGHTDGSLLAGLMSSARDWQSVENLQQDFQTWFQTKADLWFNPCVQDIAGVHSRISSWRNDDTFICGPRFSSKGHEFRISDYHVNGDYYDLLLKRVHNRIGKVHKAVYSRTGNSSTAADVPNQATRGNAATDVDSEPAELKFNRPGSRKRGGLLGGLAGMLFGSANSNGGAYSNRGAFQSGLQMPNFNNMQQPFGGSSGFAGQFGSGVGYGPLRSGYAGFGGGAMGSMGSMGYGSAMGQYSPTQRYVSPNYYSNMGGMNPSMLAAMNRGYGNGAYQNMGGYGPYQNGYGTGSVPYAGVAQQQLAVPPIQVAPPMLSQIDPHQPLGRHLGFRVIDENTLACTVQQGPGGPVREYYGGINPAGLAAGFIAPANELAALCNAARSPTGTVPSANPQIMKSVTKPVAFPTGSSAQQGQGSAPSRPISFPAESTTQQPPAESSGTKQEF